jgi:hypothetical protein
MRLFFSVLTISALMLATLIFSGCAKQWDNPKVQNKHKAAAQFETDSVKCEVAAGEEYQLNKRKQTNFYDRCMSDKGWIQREGTGYTINPK